MSSSFHIFRWTFLSCLVGISNGYSMLQILFDGFCFAGFCFPTSAIWILHNTLHSVTSTLKVSFIYQTISHASNMAISLTQLFQLYKIEFTELFSVRNTQIVVLILSQKFVKISYLRTSHST